MTANDYPHWWNTLQVQKRTIKRLRADLLEICDLAIEADQIIKEGKGLPMFVTAMDRLFARVKIIKATERLED